MTAAQRLLKEDLDDARRVARLRAAAVTVEDRTYSTVWTMRDGSRVERGCARGVAAYGTLPSLVTMVERTLKADRETVTYFRRCEAQARLRAKRTGSAAWEAAAAEWVMARFHTEADIRRHLRELIRLRQGRPAVTEYPLGDYVPRSAA